MYKYLVCSCFFMHLYYFYIVEYIYLLRVPSDIRRKKNLSKTYCMQVVECSLLYPRYEVYRGYIVFAFSVIMFVCLSVCLFVCKLFFFRQRFLSNFLG